MNSTLTDIHVVIKKRSQKNGTGRFLKIVKEAKLDIQKLLELNNSIVGSGW